MAFTNIMLSKGSETVSAPVGYSFTTFFFGPLPALFRGDLAAAGWILLIGLLACLPFLGWFLAPGYFIIPAIYNRLFIARRLALGWQMADVDASQLQRFGLTSAEAFPLKGDELKHIIIGVLVFVCLIGLICCTAVGAAMALGS